MTKADDRSVAADGHDDLVAQPHTEHEGPVAEAELRAAEMHQPGLVAEVASDELADIDRLVETTKQLERRINELVRALAPSFVGAAGAVAN